MSENEEVKKCRRCHKTLTEKSFFGLCPRCKEEVFGPVLGVGGFIGMGVLWLIKNSLGNRKE